MSLNEAGWEQSQVTEVLAVGFHSKGTENLEAQWEVAGSALN